MKKLIKNIIFGIWIYFNLVHLRDFSKKMRQARATGNWAFERENILKATKTWGTNIVKKLKITLNVEGLENIPEGPVVFVSNHQGYGDIPMYCAAITTKQFGFVAKEELGKIPYFGNWIRDIRSVFIKRNDPRASLRAIDEGIQFLNDGFSLVIFPEGTRSKGPDMSDFKKGSLRLATKPGVPIVPVTVNNTYRIFEEKGYTQSATVDFFIHPAIETKGLSKTEQNELPERVEAIVRTKLEDFQARERL